MYYGAKDLTPTPAWSPQILGHPNQTNHPAQYHHTTIPIIPTKCGDVFQYWEDLIQDHNNLLNLNMFNF